MSKNAISTLMEKKNFSLYCKKLHRLPKTIRSCDYKKVGKAAYDWFILQRSQQIPIHVNKRKLHSTTADEMQRFFFKI